ncbi:serine/threonine-protein kinase, partial [Bifidobacterium sp.]
MEASRSIPPQIPGYTLIKRLGSGSEADVYLYQQLSPARQVAIKISKNTLDPRAAVRFRSEANFMGQISTHPYILSVYENGVTVNGRGYTVFEYAPGGNYKTFLEHGRLTADQMLTVGIDLASALFTAHRKGIIHRDIKPSNILINAHNMPMLADFGIAGSVYGRPGVGFTIAWAAPEVLAQGGGGNESSDIYSLGATLFAMLIGQSPYEYFYADVLGDSQRQVRAERLKSVILNNPLPKLNRPDVPAEVERVLRKALSRTPEDRYYSALEFARDMQRVQQALYGRAVQTTVEGVPDYPQNMYAQTSAFDQSAPVAKQHARWVKPLAVTVAAAAAVVVMALAFVTVVMPNMDAASDNSKVQVQN